MFLYYKYAPDGSKLIVLSYVDDFVYWYTNEDNEKWFVYTLGKRFHVNFLGYAHWFMSIIISHFKDHTISMDQAGYATSIVPNIWILSQLREAQSFTRQHYQLT